MQFFIFFLFVCSHYYTIWKISQFSFNVQKNWLQFKAYKLIGLIYEQMLNMSKGTIINAKENYF